MVRRRFSTADIVRELLEHEAGALTQEVCRRHGISRRTFYRWKGIWGNNKNSEAKSLTELTDENHRLKQLLAESMLNVAATHKSDDRS